MRPLLIKSVLCQDDTRGVRATLCTTLALLLAASPAFARPERRVVRHGHGSGRSEIVLGTSHRDTLFGRGGRDTLRGGRGADRLYGGTNDDRLSGGTAADHLNGGARARFLSRPAAQRAPRGGGRGGPASRGPGQHRAVGGAGAPAPPRG